MERAGPGRPAMPDHRKRRATYVSFTGDELQRLAEDAAQKHDGNISNWIRALVKAEWKRQERRMPRAS